MKNIQRHFSGRKNLLQNRSPDHIDNSSCWDFCRWDLLSRLRDCSMFAFGDTQHSIIIVGINISMQDWEELLKQLEQTALLQAYRVSTPEQKSHLEDQLQKLNQTYPGGLKDYHSRARILLRESAEGANPYANYIVKHPKGVQISYDHIQTWLNYEEVGLANVHKTAFVLVAGGLGERLGYPGIKVSLPIEQLSQKTFLQYYAEYLLAFQSKYCKGETKVPLAIMTSDDTYEATVRLLEQHSYYGLEKTQLSIMKQEKVPAMINNNADFAFSKTEHSLEIETKPHGHGDVHTLLYQHKLPEKWLKEGKQWIVVFQDTNPLAMRSVPLLLGVSATNNWDFNSITVKRKPKQAVGAIVTLIDQHKSETQLTINVEYNLIESLFKSLGGEPVDKEGYSLLPGNINCFAIKLETYARTLDKTKGNINEFINPKYGDETKTGFKSSTRLECLMQDYPKLLQNCQKVGFTQIPKDYSFTTVKNDLKTANGKINMGLSGESAGSCEADLYANNRRLFRLCGAVVEESESVEAGGAKLNLFPLLMFGPQFATCLHELKHKIGKMVISKHSSLLVGGDVFLEGVEVDGNCRIEGKKGEKVRITETGKNYARIEKLEENAPAWLQIRGYQVKI